MDERSILPSLWDCVHSRSNRLGENFQVLKGSENG